MTDDYYRLWSDADYAARQLSGAIIDYETSHAGGSVSPIGKDQQFFFEADGDPVIELTAWYKELLEVNPKASNALLLGATRLYRLNVTDKPKHVNWLTVYITGCFLMIASLGSSSLHAKRLFESLRPLRTSRSEQERDLYYSALLLAINCVATVPPAEAHRLLKALHLEWEFLERVREPSASLARILCKDQPEQWPVYAAVICESTWPVTQAKPNNRREFENSLQRLVSDVGAEQVALQLHRLVAFLELNPDRGDAVMRAIFAPSLGLSDSGPESSPYVIRNEVAETIPALEDWRISASGTTENRRQFAVRPAQLSDWEVNKLVQFLTGVLGSITLVLSAAA